MRISLLICLLAQDSGDLEKLQKKFDDEKTLAATQRIATVAAIGGVKTDAAAKLLAEVFDKEKDGALRLQAIKSLLECSTPVATRKLATVGADTKASLAFRSAALRGLTQAKTKEGIDLARSIVKETSELRVEAYQEILRNYPL